jgi:hypothetical protein
MVDGQLKWLHTALVYRVFQQMSQLQACKPNCNALFLPLKTWKLERHTR